MCHRKPQTSPLSGIVWVQVRILYTLWRPNEIRWSQMAPKSGQRGPLWVPKWVLPGTMFLGVPGRTPKWSQMVPKWCPNGSQGETKDLQSEPMHPYRTNSPKQPCCTFQGKTTLYVLSRIHYVHSVIHNPTQLSGRGFP